MDTRIVYTKIWDDKYFRSLDDRGQKLFLYLLTNSSINTLHIMEESFESIAFKSKIPEDVVAGLMDRFALDKKIDFCEDYVLVANAVKYTRFNGILNNKAKVIYISRLSDEVFVYFGSYFIEELSLIKKESLASMTEEADPKKKNKYRDLLSLVEGQLNRGIDRGIDRLRNKKPETGNNNSGFRNLNPEFGNKNLETSNDGLSDKEIESTFDNPGDRAWQEKSSQCDRALPQGVHVGFIDLRVLFLIAVSLFLLLIPIKRRPAPIRVIYAEPVQQGPVVSPEPEKPLQSPHTGNVLSVEDVKSVARGFAAEYKINPDTFLCVLQKEAGFASRRPDGSLKCGDGGASCGLAQIQLPTWISMRNHAGWSTDDLRHDDYENLRTTAYGLATLWREHWTGYRICHYQFGMNL